MTHSSYMLRGLLYMAIAALPEIRLGVEHRTPPLIIALGAAFAALVALRAFVDKSPAEVVHPDLQPDLQEVPASGSGSSSGESGETETDQ